MSTLIITQQQEAPFPDSLLNTPTFAQTLGNISSKEALKGGKVAQSSKYSKRTTLPLLSHSLFPCQANSMYHQVKFC